MGFFNNVQGMMNNATSSAGRSVELLKLNNKLKEANQERTKLAAQLGAALYERTKGDSAFVAGLESLYEGIGRLDEQRAAINAQINQVEKEGREEVEARQVFLCPNCKTEFSSSDMFCSGCGKRVEELLVTLKNDLENEPQNPCCPSCGYGISAEDMFCMGCGINLQDALREPMPDPQDSSETSAEEADVADNKDTNDDLVCPQCGAVFDEGDLFCMTCGCKLT